MEMTAKELSNLREQGGLQKQLIEQQQEQIGLLEKRDGLQQLASMMDDRRTFPIDNSQAERDIRKVKVK